MALSRPEVESLVQRYLDRVREQVPVEAAYVYGSYARGGPDEWSDVDVAVVSSAFGRDRHAELVLLSRARLPDAIAVEALPFSLHEHDTLPRGSFLREVLRTGWRIV